MLPNRGHGWFLALLGTWSTPQGPWLKLGQPHPEQQMLVPSLGTNHLHGLVTKLDDHVFWNGRWGDYWVCRGKPLVGVWLVQERISAVRFLGQGGSSVMVTSA